MPYGIDFVPFAGDDNEEEKLSPEEKEEKEISSLLGELEYADRILTHSGGPEVRAINRQLSEMPDEKIRQIIEMLPVKKAKKIQAHMNNACIAGQVERFKKFLDLRLANC